MITCIVLLYLVSCALGHEASSNESIDREHQDIEYLFQSDNDHTHRNEYAGSEVNNYIVTEASTDKEYDQSLANIQTINMDKVVDINNQLIESLGSYPLVSNSQNNDSVMVNNMCFPNDYYHQPSSSSSSSFVDFNFYQSNLPMSPIPFTSDASSSSSSSWYRIHNHTHFFYSPYNHNTSSSSTMKSRSAIHQYSNTSITMNQRYLILKNTIKSAIEPFLKWMKQNSIQLFKQTILFLKASEVYLCTLLSDVKCVLLHQSQRFDEFLDTLHDSGDDSDYYYFNHYQHHGDSGHNTSTEGGYYYSSMTNWLSPDDILFRASISLRQNHTASPSSSSSSSYSRYHHKHHHHHHHHNQQHIADSSSSSSSSTHRVLPELSSKLNNKNLKVKGIVKSKGYISSSSSIVGDGNDNIHNDDNISSNSSDNEHPQMHNQNSTSNESSRHQGDNTKPNSNSSSNNDRFHYIQSFINYWIKLIIQLFTFLYTDFILPGLQHKFFQPVLFVWNSLDIKFFPTTDSSSSSRESQSNESGGGDIIYTSLGPSLLICFMIVAFVTSILQFGISTGDSGDNNTITSTSSSRRGSDKLNRKRIGSVGGTIGDDTSTFNYTATNGVHVIPDATDPTPTAMTTSTTARNTSSAASTVMFQRMVFFIKLCVLLTVVLTLYSYLVTVENISRHRLVQRTRVKAVNQYILKPSTSGSSSGASSSSFDKYNPFISHPSNTAQKENICTNSDDTKHPSHVTSTSSNNKRTETLNLQWINTAIDSLWLVGSDGGLGPYLSETIETILNTELSAVPPNILAQVRVNRFSFGVDPPVVRAINSQYEIRNKRHCQSLKHDQHYPHHSNGGSSTSSSSSQQQSQSQSFFKQKPKATSPPSSVSTDQQQQFSTDDSTKSSSSTKTEQQQQQPQQELNNFYWRSTTTHNTAEQNSASSTTTSDSSASNTTTSDASSFSSSAAPLYDIINTVRSKLSSLNQHIDTSFPFPHYRYDQPRSYSSNKRKQKQQQKQQKKKASYQYKYVRSDEVIRGCQVLTADIDIGYVSKDLDIVLALRPTSDVQTLYPEINVALTELSFAGKLRMEFELIPEYPFVGNTTFSFLEVPSLDMTISGFGSVDLSSLPGVYNLVNSTVHWLLLQYTQPNAGHVDLKPYICPKCVDILVPSTFSTRFRESFSVLSNRTSILTHELQTKSLLFSKNIQSILKIKRKEIVKGMKSFQKFLLDTKHAIERDYEPSFLLADTE